MNNSARYNGIASLRGIGAMLVFVSHLHIGIPYNIYFMIGRIGVVVFFLIMGYLSIESREKRNCGQYVINRFARMYPEYWLLVLISLPMIDNLNVKSVLLNLSLFNELFGVECILGASWMMPVQVVFYIVVAIAKKKFLCERNYVVALVFLGVSSIASGVARNFLGIGTPTAFPLLLSVAILGMIFYCNKSQKISRKILLIMCLFEFVLVASTYLSYDNWLFYVLAYNIGIVLFIGVNYFNREIKILSALGKIGFTFFLSFDIVYRFLLLTGIAKKEQNMSILACLAEAILCILIAVVFTIFVERPVLSLSKKIEERLENTSEY